MEEEEEKIEKGERETRGRVELGGGERRTSDEETKKNDSSCSRLLVSFSLSLLFLFSSPFSEALIFNDILGRTQVPLMHGHYNMLSFSLLFSFLILLSLSVPLQRTRACVYTACDSPGGCFFHRPAFHPPFPPPFSSFLDCITEAS